MWRTAIAVVLGCCVIAAGVSFAVHTFGASQTASTAAMSIPVPDSGVPSNTSAPSTDAQILQPLPSSITSDQKRIEHPKYHFVLTVASSTQVDRYDEGSDSETLVFYDPHAGTQFQLFITPYNQKEITKARLVMDIKSGDIREPKEVVLGNGTHALIFWSHAPLVGETREVWFLYRGYLFEATAPHDLDAWLANILNSVQPAT